jgi:hypothetical protein
VDALVDMYCLLFAFGSVHVLYAEKIGAGYEIGEV